MTALGLLPGGDLQVTRRSRRVCFAPQEVGKYFSSSPGSNRKVLSNTTTTSAVSLFWEGEKGHANDQRIINTKLSGEAIHLFYREIHHSPFEYKGLVELVDSKVLIGEPSKFVFRLFHDQSAEDDLLTHQNELVVLPETERESVIKARIGQGVFRKQLLEMWDGCAVTGVKLPDLLRASHIKPWRYSTNAERTNR